MEWHNVPEPEDWVVTFRLRRLRRHWLRLMRRYPLLWLLLGAWLAGGSGAATWVVLRLLLMLGGR